MNFKMALLCTCLVLIAHAQDCKVGGKRCVDHEQCCGGCCFDGVCIDTYRSCLTSLEVCKDHVCRGDESCVVFRPPQCNACEPLPLCRDLSETLH